MTQINPPFRPPAHKVAGVDVHFLDYESSVRIILSHAGPKPMMCSFINPHSIVIASSDSEFFNALAESNLVLPDGIGVHMAARLLGYPTRGRVTGPNLLLELCRSGDGLSHYFIGGLPGVADDLARALSKRYKHLKVAGTFSPPFSRLSETEHREMIDKINATNPDIIWVGLGAPKQEKWIHESLNELNARAVLGVGAAFDFHSGRIPRAPEVAQQLGLEWLFRMLNEPKRLWRRNCDSATFVYLVLRQKFATL